MKTLILALLFIPAVAVADGLTPAQATALHDALDAVCPLIEQEAFELQIIAEEKTNPAGVVDLRRLHEAGQVLAETREQLRTARKENAAGLKIAAKVLHKSPDLGFCAAWDKKQENAQ